MVEKLTKNVNEGHLQEIFGSYGPVKEIDLPMNRQCECPQVCCFHTTYELYPQFN